MKYNVRVCTTFDGCTIEDTDFYADTDHEATEYALIQAQFKSYEEYILNLISEDGLFTMVCQGVRGTHIKA